MKAIVIGCGLSGMVIARELAEYGYKVIIYEKRSHIGGNIFDEYTNDGLLIQKYGPHCFFTEHKEIKDYIERFIDVENCYVECETHINGKSLPMPFNFKTIDLLFEKKEAEILKSHLKLSFPKQEIVSVTDLLECEDSLVNEYGKFMYEYEYKLYTAKQWGRNIDEISPSIFKRVPVYLSYRSSYQKHEYQFLPRGGFTKLAASILNHANIEVRLNIDASEFISFDAETGEIFWRNNQLQCPLIYTGALDALLDYRYGILPYRSLEFIWKKLDQESYQNTAITAYPQADKITRVTEYKKLPVQDYPDKTLISIEVPFEYVPDSPVGNEPYYPVINDDNMKLYNKYKSSFSKCKNFYFSGRLADYCYYNMDAAILRAKDVAYTIITNYNGE